MKKQFAQWLLRRMGWRLEGSRPDIPQYVLIAAPHTSNWDFPMMLLFAAAFDIPVTWMAKHTLFYPPVGWLMRAMGGMPIVRHKNQNIVTIMVEAFRDGTEMVLVVPTEGTRALARHWKSGFYHIARQAHVPVVPSFLDFGNKRGGFGAPVTLTGIVSNDMQIFRDFYAGMSGKFPEKFGPIRLKEEPGRNDTST